MSSLSWFECKGPFTIRPARSGGSSQGQCNKAQASVMETCLVRCQKDECCQAFGLDTSGNCVTSNRSTEELNFVKESKQPFPKRCKCTLCKNAAECDEEANDPACVCRAGFTGQYCETAMGPVWTSDGPLTVSNGYNAGDWGDWDTCPVGSYAAGIQLQIAGNQGPYDDTGVNAIHLLCRSASNMTFIGSVSSLTMEWGSLRDIQLCPPDYWIVNYKLKVQPQSAWTIDNTAVEGLSVQCLGPGMKGSIMQELTQSADLTLSEGDWGDWSAGCPLGTAVCSIKTRVQPNQGRDWAGIDIDDVALSNAEMHCCDF